MEMNLETEIKRGYKDSFIWFEQVGNILSSLIWSVGTWLTLSSTLTTLTLFLMFIAGEFEAINYESAFLVVRTCLLGAGLIAAFVVLVFGLPKKLRNETFARKKRISLRHLR